MMNFPGVLSASSDVLEKINLFSSQFKDGHCPGLTGKSLNAYALTGISSCHESITLKEAEEKLAKSMAH